MANHFGITQAEKVGLFATLVVTEVTNEYAQNSFPNRSHTKISSMAECASKLFQGVETLSLFDNFWSTVELRSQDWWSGIDLGLMLGHSDHHFLTDIACFLILSAAIAGLILRPAKSHRH
jgi:hypothetical protein